MPAEESLRKVGQFRELQQQLLHKYEAIEQWLKEAESGHPGLPYWLMTVSYGKHISRALTDWCDETLAALHAMAPDTNETKDTTDATVEEPQPD